MHVQHEMLDLKVLILYGEERIFVVVVQLKL